MTHPIIDAHVHVWQVDGVLYPTKRIVGSDAVDVDAPVGLLMREMETAGVDKAVLVQPSNYGFDNRYLADCLARYPGRFAGVMRIDPVDAAAPARLSMWVEEYGIRGLRIAPFRILDGEWVHDQRIAPLWRRAERLQIPVCFQGVRGRLGQLVQMVRRLCETYPGLAIALDHMGHPTVADGAGSSESLALLSLAGCRQVYVKVSGHYALSAEPYPHPDTWPLMQTLLSSFGPERLMWGSDFPYILQHGGHGMSLDLLGMALPGLSELDKEWLLGRTAGAIWSTSVR